MTINGWDKRVIAGDPAALRRLLEAIAEKHRITIYWTAEPRAWRAGKNYAYVPPPVDKSAAAIGLHELAHCIAGPCPRTGDHRHAKVEGKTLICLGCEERAWEVAVGLVPFDRQMHEQLRMALGTYRRSTPAPVRVQEAADRLMGTVSYAERTLAGLRWQDRLEKQRRATESAARDAAREAGRRRRFAALQARLDAARR